ncbi:hypothetical protein K503DRAFT_804924 [Rhizopogon vinicolor AM-OR11-026]|uniref:Uncharacterized protein n=1 Tax=Rhizopogon vinicolor AM-OR11-026 TaxID=1314800 RepID=A0A1B7MJN6_9AGAM|nr:hypothetical protein K503DRAFT_804924 [Rhizopogon vinicolor AM-OR11-026]
MEVDGGGPETIKELAQKRLVEKGWDHVHPALFVTVRILNELSTCSNGEGIFGCSKDNGAVIFEDTFVTGVRVLYLHIFMEAYHTDSGLNSKFPIEHLKEEAEDLLKETDRLARNPHKVAIQVDPGFISSFVSYPAGIARVYHAQMALYGSDPVERMFSFMNVHARS